MNCGARHTKALVRASSAKLVDEFNRRQLQPITHWKLSDVQYLLSATTHVVAGIVLSKTTECIAVKCRSNTDIGIGKDNGIIFQINYIQRTSVRIKCNIEYTL